MSPKRSPADIEAWFQQPEASLAELSESMEDSYQQLRSAL
jgi:hypothetical protein